MKIDSIELFHVAMPLVVPWRTAYGEDAAIESVLVRMASGPHVGWGESCPLAAPCYSAEWAAGVFACLRDWMAPAVVGRAVESGAALEEQLAGFKGNRFAKAALDTAWWSLEARRRDEPLYRLLGGTRERVDVGADFGVTDSIDDLLRDVGGAFEAGFSRVKLKFRPGWDVNMLRAVRQEFATEAIHVDCNAAYRIEDADLFCRLDDFCLEMIEQPLAHDDLIDHARLQEMIRTPICLDESITSPEKAELAIELGSCRYVNIKPGRSGGLTAAVAIHDACREAGIGCWVGGMLESGVGARLCLALATLEGMTYPSDIFPSARFYTEDLGQPDLRTITRDDGRVQVAVADTPGLGAEPDPQRLERCTIQSARIE